VEGRERPVGSEGSGGSGSPVSSENSVSYAGSGVNLEAADQAVSRIAAIARSATRPEVVDGIGGFGGSFALNVARMESPLLVASTDGVGTKLAVAHAARRYDTVGLDLVAMCVDDIVCVGAEPLFMLDYIATGRLEPDQIELLVAGIAKGCAQAGCALLGGELAEHPGEMEPGKFDMAGFAVGVVESAARLGPNRVRAGDVLVGLPSPGLRSNGFSLARRVLLGEPGALERKAWSGADHSLGDEMLKPSLIYAPAVLAAVRTGSVHAAAHITGGGIAGNLSRVIPDGCTAVVDRASWTEPEIFEEIRRLGPVDDSEMQKVFNLGIGMILVVAPEGVGAVVSAVTQAGAGSGISGLVGLIVGEVQPGAHGVRLERA